MCLLFISWGLTVIKHYVSHFIGSGFIARLSSSVMQPFWHLSCFHFSMGVPCSAGHDLVCLALVFPCNCSQMMTVRSHRQGVSEVTKDMQLYLPSWPFHNVQVWLHMLCYSLIIPVKLPEEFPNELMKGLHYIICILILISFWTFQKAHVWEHPGRFISPWFERREKFILPLKYNTHLILIKTCTKFGKSKISTAAHSWVSLPKPSWINYHFILFCQINSCLNGVSMLNFCTGSSAW